MLTTGGLRVVGGEARVLHDSAHYNTCAGNVAMLKKTTPRFHTWSAGDIVSQPVSHYPAGPQLQHEHSCVHRRRHLRREIGMQQTETSGWRSCYVVCVCVDAASHRGGVA